MSTTPALEPYHVNEAVDFDYTFPSSEALMEWRRRYQSLYDYDLRDLPELTWDLGWVGGYNEAVKLLAKEPNPLLPSELGTQGSQLLEEKYEIARLYKEILYERFGGHHMYKDTCDLVEWNANGYKFGFQIWYPKMVMAEMGACYEVAVKSLRALNDYIFDSSMPTSLQLEAESNGIKNISEIFMPSVNRHLKLKLLSRLAPKLQVIARIMAISFRKFAIGRNPYHPRVCRTLALDLVKKKFTLSEEFEKRIYEFIDSDPKYKGESIFPVDDSGDGTGVYELRETVDGLIRSSREEILEQSKEVLEMWEGISRLPPRDDESAHLRSSF
ncbi:hypothetical protein BDQ17DRAFT_1333646 [Cyathus striatus]|nr:hypothetical protein BDQ17DRAFT_1333646 [Cyathus striatus]